MISRFLLIISILLTLAAPKAVLANVVSRSDIEYHSVEAHGYQFISPESYFSWLPDLINYNRYFTEQYEQSFFWRLDEPAALILASEQNQIANGFATVMPTLETVFYPSGAELLDQFATKSWLYTLLSHETAHLYQLNVKSRISQMSKKIVGNPMFWLPLGFPIFIHPNQVTPSFLMEGNAVMNESRFGLGGRLYSGEYRALAMAMIQDDLIDSTRLINDHLDFPFGTEKYIVGGYFSLYLAERYGIDKTNKLFYHQARHFINPLELKSTFELHLRESYNRLIYDFTEHYKELAQQQKAATEEAFLTTIARAPMNHDQGKIFFVTADGASEPYLNIFDKESRVLKREQIDLPMAKLFQLEDNDFYAATSYIVDTTNTKYSLFGRSYKLRRDYLSQIVQDIRGGHTLSMDAVKSFVEPQLYLDDKFFATSHSSAILSEQGDVYYFIQQGDQRTLMKNNERLTSYRGYYGKPLEVDSSGIVYFIGSTASGSSLFAYAYGEIVRLSHSDRIVDARKVAPERFIVCEVNSQGYAYKFIPTQAIAERPHHYNYDFEESPQIKTFTESTKSAPNPGIKTSSYNSLSSLRYSSMDIGLLFNTAGNPFGQAIVNLTDPLQFNRVQFGYARGIYGTNSGLVNYQNTKHRLGWYLGYSFLELADVNLYGDGTFDVLDVDELNLAFAGLTYPIWQRERWRLGWTGQLGWRKDTATSEDQVGLLNQLQLRWTQSYMLGFEPYRLFDLSVSHQALVDREDVEQYEEAWGLFSQINYDIGSQNYLSLRAGWALSGSDSILIGNTSPLYKDPFFVSRLLPSAVITANEAQLVGVGYKKGLNHSYYFSRFPLSLRRWAPFIQANYIAYREHEDEPDDENLAELAWGADIELLFAHKVPLRLTLGQVLLKSESAPSWMVHFSTKHDF